MSETEQFYHRIATHFGVKTPWTELNFMEQSQFISGINAILDVVVVVKSWERDMENAE